MIPSLYIYCFYGRSRVFTIVCGGTENYMNKYDIIVTSTFGLESVVKRELKNLGCENLRVSDGMIEFEGTERDIALCNLWIRSGSRVLIKLKEFSAVTFEELFQGVYSVNWEDIIPFKGHFIITGKSARSGLSSVPACQSVGEKAVIKRLQTKYKAERFPKSGERYIIQISLNRDIATVTLDTSGTPLYKRGYRKAIGAAPLKETMAAGMVALSYWKRDRLLFDPCCGSGTILIEAALMAKNIAPGLNRSFDFEEWGFFDGSVMAEERKKAEAVKDKDFSPKLKGSDIDPQVLGLARENAERAGVAEFIDFEERPLKDVRLEENYGICITNPPYGERMGDIDEVEELYRDMGKIFGLNDTWSAYFLTSHEGFERLYGRKADKKRKLFNGNVKVDYYQYFGKRPPKK
ncbi:MAG: class I SAM-dependent RNA methyltransferase [Clostridiales bacterium]|nr:class I SAM-dependent RNA methyltransferase [Clostridiales bacterium]